MIEELVSQVWGSDDGVFATAFGESDKPATRQWFPRSKRALLKAIREAARRRDVHLHWSPARFSEARRRNDAATHCTAIVVDVDADADDPEVMEAVKAFVDATLRPSWVVRSGRGLHLYWTLTEPAPVDEWRPVALAMRDTFKLFGSIASDAQAIATPARLIRCPGSWNPKRQTRALLTPAGTHLPYDLDHIRAALPHTSEPDDGPSERPPALSNPWLMLRKCAPIRHMAETGEQSYEAFFAAARLFAWSENEEEGRRAFHEFSRNYDGYDPNEVNAKFDNALETAQMPPTCQLLRDVSGKECDGCPLSRQPKGMPTRLPQELATAAVPAPESSGVPDAVLGTLAVAMQRVEEIRQSFASPVPIREKSKMETALRRLLSPNATVVMCPVSGRLFAMPKKMADPPIELASNGFAVHEIVSTDGGTAMLLSIFSRKGARKRRYQSADELVAELEKYRFDIGHWLVRVAVPHGKPVKDRYTPAQLIQAMDGSSDGMVVSTASPAHAALLRAYVGHQVMATQATRSVSKFVNGWDEHGNFLMGDIRLMADGEVEVHPFPVFNDPQGLIRPRGDVSAARAAAAQLHSVLGRTGRMLFWLALGAPLFQFLPQNTGFAYVSGPSGVGKTLLGTALSSLYSSAPDTALVAGQDTLLAIFHTLGRMRNLPVMIDELTLKGEQEARMLALQITQGRERRRMRRDGASTIPPETWATSVIATTNDPLVERIPPLDDTSLAQIARVLDIRVGHAAELWQDMDGGVESVKELSSFGGMPGVDFMLHVMLRFGLVQDSLSSRMDEIGFFPASDLTTGDLSRYWRACRAVAVTAAHIYAEALGLDAESEAHAIDGELRSRFDSMVRAVRLRAQKICDDAVSKVYSMHVAYKSRISDIDAPPKLHFSAGKPTTNRPLLVATAGSSDALLYISRRKLGRLISHALELDRGARLDAEFIIKAAGLSASSEERITVSKSNGSTMVVNVPDAVAIPVTLQTEYDPNDLETGITIVSGRLGHAA